MNKTTRYSPEVRERAVEEIKLTVRSSLKDDERTVVSEEEQQREPNKSIALFRGAVERRPLDQKAHFKLGVGLAEKGDLDGAITVMDKASTGTITNSRPTRRVHRWLDVRTAMAPVRPCAWAAIAE